MSLRRICPVFHSSIRATWRVGGLRCRLRSLTFLKQEATIIRLANPNDKSGIRVLPLDLGQASQQKHYMLPIAATRFLSG